MVGRPPLRESMDNDSMVGRPPLRFDDDADISGSHAADENDGGLRPDPARGGNEQRPRRNLDIFHQKTEWRCKAHRNMTVDAEGVAEQ